MTTFVLVHGAWLDASCWNAVADALRQRGATVLVPDLPGHGHDHTAVAGRTLDAYAARVQREIETVSGPVVLVGHSMGGIVISTVAERHPDRVARLVYVAAYLLGDGESIQGQQDPDSHIPPAMRPAADWSTVAIDAAAMPKIFFHDVPPDDSAPLIAASAPAATAPFGTPLQISEHNWGRVPRAYITTRQDRAVTPALQDRFLSARPCEPVLSMETGHAPFAAQPQLLAAHLATLGGLDIAP